jgi:hypothetical protein
LRCSTAGRDGSGRDDRLLVPIELPPLTGSELRRLFLRLPALRALPQEDRTLVARAIGGHPRLIEFVDALLTVVAPSCAPPPASCTLSPASTGSTCVAPVPSSTRWTPGGWAAVCRWPIPPW